MIGWTRSRETWSTTMIYDQLTFFGTLYFGKFDRRGGLISVLDTGLSGPGVGSWHVNVLSCWARHLPSCNLLTQEYKWVPDKVLGLNCDGLSSCSREVAIFQVTSWHRIRWLQNQVATGTSGLNESKLATESSDYRIKWLQNPVVTESSGYRVQWLQNQMVTESSSYRS